MPVTFHDVLAEVGLRANALIGTTPTALETTYNTRPLTTSNWQSARFSLTAVLDAIVDTEAEIAAVIADTPQSRWRNVIEVDSASLANNSRLPTYITSSTNLIIGKGGVVRDASDGIPLTEQPWQVVYHANVLSPVLGVGQYYYTIDSQYIRHTRTNVIIRVCVFDLVARKTAAAANNAILFEALRPAYVSGALSRLHRDGRFTDQAGLYGQHFGASLSQIQAGGGASELPEAAMTLNPES